jgi:hypothetical protein
MDDLEHRKQDRIREVAHRIWREEGCPDGRADAHWQMARDLVAVEEGYNLATEPNPITDPTNIGPEGEPVEEAKLQENLGEFPTLTDQGEQQPPSRVNLGQAAPGGEPLAEAERRGAGESGAKAARDGANAKSARKEAGAKPRARSRKAP